MRFVFILIAFMAGAGASPILDVESLETTATINKRSMCGQWDTTTSGSYSLTNDLWGESAGSGWQCTNLDWANSGSIGWQTSWNWSGGKYNVKSFAHVSLVYTPMQISKIKSISTHWQWSYSGSNMVSDVAYDMFLGWNPTGSNSYEIMIWLGEIGGAGPISSSGKAVATMKIGNYNWSLFIGPNGSTTVYSFVVSGGYTSNYSGDLFPFIQYLENHYSLNKGLYLQSCTGGTEPFVGSSATFVTSSFGLSLST